MGDIGNRAGEDPLAGGLPETEIALCCARTSLDAVSRARLAMLLQQSVDWPRLLGIAVHHGVMPLVCHHLSGSFVDAVPQIVLRQLQERFRANSVRNLILTREMTRIVNLLEGRGIAAIAYKGPLLAMAAYGSLGLRSFSDLDILVDKRHVAEAARLLHEQGYRPSYALTEAQAAAYLDAESAYNFMREGQNHWVELHWAITPHYFSFRLDPAELTARSRWVVAAGARCRTLSLEDLLLVLCVHGTKHCWDRIEWVSSLAELVRRHEALDWDQVVRRAADRGGSRMLGMSLALANGLLGVPLPDAVRASVEADPAATLLARQASARLRTGADGIQDRSEQFRFHLLARERLRDRTRYMLRLATTQTLGDWSFLRLPSGLGWAYRVIRPLRLVAKFGPAAIGRVLSVLVGVPRSAGTRS
jgi:hypothetical protein